MEVMVREAGTTAASVLTSTQVTCRLPVKDMARARRFHEETLDLALLGAKPDGKFIYRCAGTEVALLPKQRGVVFDDYDLPRFKTVEHVRVLGAERAAWLRDSEGNVLCLYEDLG